MQKKRKEGFKNLPLSQKQLSTIKHP